MRSRPPRPWSFGPLLLLACAKPPDIAGDIESYSDSRTDANVLSCDCPQLLGFADSIQCDEALGPIGTTARQCFAMVLDGHEDAAQEYLECATAAYGVYVNCLETSVSCEQDIYDGCTADHQGALASCPQLPASVQSMFESCVD